MRTLQVMLAGALSLVLASCESVDSEVSRFHDFSAEDIGKAFVVVPYKDQEGSVEFRQYARSVSSYLQEAGFVPVDDVARADYAVLFNYGVSDGETITSAIPLWGQTGGRTTSYSGTTNITSGLSTAYGTYSGQAYTTPTYGVVGMLPYTKTVYGRGLWVDIIDLRRSSDGELYRVFEGKVLSSGESGTFATVADCLIGALFDEFPGESGVTKDVSTYAIDCVR